MKKNIFVNNTAATSGGALTILKEFIENVAKVSSKEYMYYIFCTADLREYESENIKIIDNIKAKRWKDRIIWDLYGLKLWSDKNNIEPNLIISLQNTAISGFKGIKQVIYLHQSIPYYKDVIWNIKNKEERIYWFYRYIYKIIIDKSVKKNYVIVQSNWLKNLIIKDHKLKNEQVYVLKPNVKLMLNHSINTRINNNTIKLFYPAAAHIYKNHILLLDAVKILIDKFVNLDVKLYLTIDKNESAYAEKINYYIQKNDLTKNVELLGNLCQQSMCEYYNNVDVLVFPSYIETYGLPLIEAAQFNKPIVVSDLDYSKEALEHYNGAYYSKHDNPYQWAEKIQEAYENKDNQYRLKLDHSNSWMDFIEIIKHLS